MKNIIHHYILALSTLVALGGADLILAAGSKPTAAGHIAALVLLPGSLLDMVNNYYLNDNPAPVGDLIEKESNKIGDLEQIGVRDDDEFFVAALYFTTYGRAKTSPWSNQNNDTQQAIIATFNNVIRAQNAKMMRSALEALYSQPYSDTETRHQFALSLAKYIARVSAKDSDIHKAALAFVASKGKRTTPEWAMGPKTGEEVIFISQPPTGPKPILTPPTKTPATLSAPIKPTPTMVGEAPRTPSTSAATPSQSNAAATITAAYQKLSGLTFIQKRNLTTYMNNLIASLKIGNNEAIKKHIETIQTLVPEFADLLTKNINPGSGQAKGRELLRLQDLGDKLGKLI